MDSLRPGGYQPLRPRAKTGGADRVRTGDPLLAKQVLYQLSYDPVLGGVILERTDSFQNLLCAIN